MTLRCVDCRSGLLAPGEQCLVCPQCSSVFPVEQGLPRFLTGTAAQPYDQQHRDPNHPIVEFFARQRWKLLEEQLPALHSALDVGSGDGFSTLYAPAGMEVVACDSSESLLLRHAGKCKVLASAERLPFPDESFDLVYSWELLHHLEDPATAVREMSRVSRRWVVCFEPNPYNPAQLAFSYYDAEHAAVRKFTPRYLRDIFAASGLSIRVLGQGGWIFPNKTPEWLFPLLRALPYRLPYLGISHYVVAVK